MLPFLIILALSIGLIAALGAWRRDRKLLAEFHKRSQDSVANGTSALEKANEDLKASQADLQRRWLYLAEAQRLSHSGTFGWKVRTGELVWSDETYRILGFARETNPTLDLAFDRVHPEDRDRLQQLRDRATKSGMDLDVEHRILLPDRVIKHVHVVAHVGYWDWDLETGEIIWSDETYRIFGFKPQERSMDIEMVSGLVHPDDREALYSTVDEEVAVGVQPVHQHRIVRPSGEVRTVQSITSKLWKTMDVRPEDGISREHNRLFGTVQDITELKQAEEASHALSRDLQESKDWLEEAQRVAHLGYWVWDLVTNRLIVSDEYCHILGLTPKNGPIDLAIVSEIIHPEDREYVFRTAEEAVRSGERADCEHRILRPSGELRVVLSLGDLKKDSSGRPYQMFGTTQDITDRKRGEEALRRSQFYLSEGQRLAHMGSWAFNDSGHYWSDELYKIYGLDPQNGAPTAEQYLALVHPQDRASMAETIKRMQEEHCGFDQIERIIRPDGQLRYVRAVAVPVLEQGVFKGFVGTTMDVTEQELLTRELRREKAYLAEAQSLTHAGSWACNFHTKQMFHLSDEVYRLHGFEPDQGYLVLDRFWDTIHPEDAPFVKTTLEDAMREGTDFYLDEYRIHHTDGSIRFLRAIGHRNASGEPGEYVGVTMDITERKRAEEERERLRQLEADLAHINRVNMLGELAASLAHEIKQPIAAAVANAGACLGFLDGEHPDI